MTDAGPPNTNGNGTPLRAEKVAASPDIPQRSYANPDFAGSGSNRQFTAASSRTSYTSGSTMVAPSREEVGALIAAAEARTDAKIVGLNAKLDNLLSNLTTGQAEGRQTTRNAAFALAGLLVAVVGVLVTVVPAVWDRASSERQMIREEVAAAAVNHQPVGVSTAIPLQTRPQAPLKRP